jgi:DNA-binding NarL/FixJ family response regulator
MIEIVVADDHAIVRDGIKFILSHEEDMMVVGEASTARGVIERLSEHECNVLLLDISMPEANGLELLRKIRKQFPTVSPIIISMFAEEQFGIRALLEGAMGYLTKGCPPAEIIDAIRTVSEGNRYITPRMAELLSRTTKPLHASLSKQEYAVFMLMVNGNTTHQIAVELHLSVKTVSNYRDRLLRKMNMRTNAELVAYAYRNKLLE